MITIATESQAQLDLFGETVEVSHEIARSRLSGFHDRNAVVNWDALTCSPCPVRPGMLVQLPWPFSEVPEYPTVPMTVRTVIDITDDWTRPGHRLYQVMCTEPVHQAKSYKTILVDDAGKMPDWRNGVQIVGTP